MNDRTSTSAVQLREVAASDLPIFFEHQRDPDATRMAAFPARDRAAFMAHWRKIMADDTVINRTILVDGQVAGNIGSFVDGGRREVCYWLGQSFWGRGIATAALAALLRLVPTRPVYAHVAAHNHGSRRVLEKCGFTVCAEPSDPRDGDDAVEEILLKLGAADDQR